ncbi:hypothetical protein HDV06_003587 [Boothiomyces sp. JEL0866]|nr:hypothetical protein HDV06_003587 [Boothiomyces sp. JEL0866]
MIIEEPPKELVEAITEKPVEIEQKKTPPSEKKTSPTVAAPVTKKIKVETISDFEMKIDNMSVGNIRLDLDEVGDMDFDFFQPSKSATIETFPTPSFTQFSPPVTTPFSTTNTYSPSNTANGVTPAPDPTSPFVLSQSPGQPEFVSPSMSPVPYELFTSPPKDSMATIKPKSIHEVLLDNNSAFVAEGHLINDNYSTDPFSFKLYPDKWAPFQLNLDHIFGDKPFAWKYCPNSSNSKPKFSVSKYTKKSKKLHIKVKDTTFRSDKFIQSYFPTKILKSYVMQSFNIENLIFQKTHPCYLIGLANCIEQLCEYFASYRICQLIHQTLNPTEKLNEQIFNEVSNTITRLVDGSEKQLKIPLENLCKQEAQSIIKQFFKSPSETKYCIVMIYNPFNDIQTILDTSILFSKLIHIIHKSTLIPVDIIQSRVLLEFTSDEKTNFMEESQVVNLLQLLFSTYNRLPKIINNETLIYSAAYTMENVLDEPKFTLDAPNLSTLLLMEPDRIIYLTFGNFENNCFAYWADSFGEYCHTDWITFSDNMQLYQELLIQTENQFNLNGFMVRLVISNINGWNVQELEEWKKILRGRFSEDKDGIASPESENMSSAVPEIKQPPSTPKQPPSTPGSAYNTPQPALEKKPPTKIQRESSIISITLITIDYSYLFLDKLEPRPPTELEWSQDGKNTCLYTWMSPQLPLFDTCTPVALCWILHESDAVQKSIHFVIHSHEQMHIRNSVFRSWNDGELPVVVKDIAKGYNLLRQANLRGEWMFEYVTKRVKVMSMLN